jgi:hypothetical protein
MDDDGVFSLEQALDASKKQHKRRREIDNFLPYSDYGPSSFQAGEWAQVTSSQTALRDDVCCAQHTTYLVDPNNFISLPMKGQHGQALTSTWSVDLQHRIEKKKRESISVGDAFSVAMAPEENMIVARIEGYADKPEAQ